MSRQTLTLSSGRVAYALRRLQADLVTLHNDGLTTPRTIAATVEKWYDKLDLEPAEAFFGADARREAEAPC